MTDHPRGDGAAKLIWIRRTEHGGDVLVLFRGSCNVTGCEGRGGRVNSCRHVRVVVVVDANNGRGEYFACACSECEVLRPACKRIGNIGGDILFHMEELDRQTQGREMT
jgi:hypothetical protein